MSKRVSSVASRCRTRLARPAGQECQAALQSAQEHRRRQHPYARGGQLEGERQSVQADANLSHKSRIGLGQDEIRTGGLGPFDKQLHCLDLGELGRIVGALQVRHG
jgi:hypothetical protein